MGFAIEDGAGPGGVLAAETDVNAAREMAFCEFGGIARRRETARRVAQIENFVKLDRGG